MASSDLIRLIGVDWGTSSLRCCAFDGEGRIIERAESAQGILTVVDGDFEAVLAALIRPWQQVATVPVVLSGMITSRNGWCETPYLPVPCSPHDLAAALVQRESALGWPLYFVPGVSQRPGDGAHPGQGHDVMRGEETELLGQLADSDGDSGWYVLPGTHSKWVNLHAGGIQGFNTFMTGEVYAVLCSHSILGRFITAEAPFDGDAFAQGVLQASKSSRSLLAQLFAVRAMPLLGAMSQAATRDYFAGLLIGAECSDALTHGASTPVLIGRGDLVARYREALELLGCAARVAAPGRAAMGQWAIAKLAVL